MRGAVGPAAWARVPAAVIATTVAASSPELSVAVAAATAGRPEIALGDGLGANVAHLGLVLGATAAIAPLAVPRRAVRRDRTAALTAPLLTAVLTADGRLDSGDGLVLLVAFGGWLSLVLHQTLRTRRADGTPRPARGLPAGAAAVAGLGLLMASAALVVTAARGIGAWLGMDDFVVGATLVAIGTCTPELVTAVVAARRGQGGMGFGLVLGSLLFNGLVAVAVAALLAPIEVPRAEAAVGLASGVGLLALATPGRSGRLGRGRGALLLAGYAAFVAVLLRFPPAPAG